jgi:hypothetical protein
MEKHETHPAPKASVEVHRTAALGYYNFFRSVRRLYSGDFYYEST